MHIIFYSKALNGLSLVFKSLKSTKTVFKYGKKATFMPFSKYDFIYKNVTIL